MDTPCKRICLYDGIAQPWFSIEGVREHLRQWLPWLDVDVQGDLLARAAEQAGASALPGDASLANLLCQIRVRSPFQTPTPRNPLKPEIDYEERLLARQTHPAAGVTYDGNELQRLAFAVLPQGERGPETIRVWFTERLFATWDENDRRYHLRVIVCGGPAIISSAGMVQAPAKPREFYVARRLGVSPGRLPGATEADCLQFEDKRTTEVAKGYAMQAAMFALTGEPFCEDKGCRLFNAHWQAEMLGAQIGEPDYCERHTKMLEALRASMPIPSP